MTPYPYPNQRLVIPGERDVTLDYAARHFVDTAIHSITNHGYFAVALSGGSTPEALYSLLAHEYKKAFDWKKALLFWSDERAVPLDHNESNYHMAMEAGFKHLPILKPHLFPMQGTGDLEENARLYEEIIQAKIPDKKFDLMMLGVGDDGHTASLFPKTKGLHVEGRLVIANYIPAKDIWRLTLTFDAINSARTICVYALGKNKADILQKALRGPFQPDELPIQRVGTDRYPALFILDEAAAFYVRSRD
jgi:6-phosphogluconolactonase